MIEEIEKTFFKPGDIVTLKHTQLHSPIMYVVEKVTKTFKHNDELSNVFKGIKCRWFDLNMDLQEAIFSTKDLIHFEGDVPEVGKVFSSCDPSFYHPMNIQSN